jgi:hypothetical protein
MSVSRVGSSLLVNRRDPGDGCLRRPFTGRLNISPQETVRSPRRPAAMHPGAQPAPQWGAATLALRVGSRNSLRPRPKSEAADQSGDWSNQSAVNELAVPLKWTARQGICQSAAAVGGPASASAAPVIADVRCVPPIADIDAAPTAGHTQRLRRRYDFMSRKLLRPSEDMPR